MILVTGATGNVGGEVVRALIEAGHQVRALVRHLRQSTLPPGVEEVVGDLNRPETLSAALVGVHGVFLLPEPRVSEEDFRGTSPDCRRSLRPPHPTVTRSLHTHWVHCWRRSRQKTGGRDEAFHQRRLRCSA